MLCRLEARPATKESERCEPTGAAELDGNGFVDRADQDFPEKRFAEIRHTAGLHGHLMHSFIVDGRYENDRQVGPGCGQPASQFDAGHPAQVNVENQTGRRARRSTIKERFGRSKDRRLKIACLQQPLDALEHARIIFNDRDHLLSHPENLVSRKSMREGVLKQH
jgi:hypothetical protein